MGVFQGGSGVRRHYAHLAVALCRCMNIPARLHLDPIALLVSNVQMPGMTGPDLARELRRSRPNLRVMLISPDPQGVLVLDSGWSFLQHPFPQSAILDKVKQILNSPPSTDTCSG
jgi:FixJ family two-component response regulator